MLETGFILLITVAELSTTTVAKEALSYQKDSLRQNQEGGLFLHLKNWAFSRGLEIQTPEALL